MPEVAVVGGGLAGLVAARHLAAAGLDVRVFERRSTIGGRVHTRHHQGFTLDRGFQVLFTGYPAVRHELDVAALDLRPFAPGAIIAKPERRTTVADPIRDPRAALSTVLTDEIRHPDKLRIFLLQRELRHRAPETIFPGRATTIHEYLADRGFSRSFVESFVGPFYGGITLDRSLSTAAAVFEYTFKMMSEGRIAVPAAGMEAIPKQLADAARAAGARIVTEADVRAVEPDTDGAGRASDHGGVLVDIGAETVEADAAVVATDPLTARSLTGLESIPTTGRGCVTQYYSLPREAAIDTGKRLLLNAVDAEPNHVVPMSTVAPEYAPPDQQLLSATFLGQPDAGDDELATRTKSALESWYSGADFGDLDLIHTDRIPFAQFDQPPGIHAELPDTTDPAGPIYLAGEYTRWSSIQGALESGRRAAAAILDDLP